MRLKWLPPRSQNMEDDREALKLMFQNCNGKKWYIKIGWKTYDDPTKWYGVKVDRQRVRSLELPGNDVTGYKTKT